MLEPHHRHRRFRRDAIDVADQEVIDHQVADDQDAAAAEAGNELVADPSFSRLLEQSVDTGALIVLLEPRPTLHAAGRRRERWWP